MIIATILECWRVLVENVRTRTAPEPQGTIHDRILAIIQKGV
jgi:hypothetical protein